MLRAPAPDSMAEPGSQQQDEGYSQFVALHQAALLASGVPQLYWPDLQRKLEGEIFDAGEIFGIMQVEEAEEEEEEEEAAAERAEIERELKKIANPGTEPSFKVIVTNEHGLRATDPNCIFLIDHAWTYRVEHARHQLMEVPGLLHRMANLVGIEFHGEAPDADVVEMVLKEMWKYNQTYQLSHGTAEDKVPVWYVMDEFGSRIQHSDEPTFGTAPFYYIPHQLAYTILWPLRDMSNGEEVSRDYAYGETDRLIRSCLLLPWQPVDLTHINHQTPEPSETHYQAIFAENKESLPLPVEPPLHDKSKIFKVYTDMQQVLNGVNYHRFEFTDNEKEADILFNFSHFKDYKRVGGVEGPKWLPRTFNLKTELPHFISYFKLLEERGEDNHWICKPWNLARSLDTHVTTNLSYIIRQRESTPKVVSKYVENPVLFYRDDVGMVKFDIRYVVLLRSVRPLKVYTYNVFWLRFANRPFTLDDLDDYEKHFTVMNYVSNVQLKQIHCDEFITMFEKQYPEYPWKSIETELFKTFGELFQAATSKPAPLGICDYQSSRAIYAIDLMLKWDTDSEGKRVMQPQILEVNFNPDCTRACKYHSTFFNDVFSTLFLDETDNCHVTSIL